MTRPGVGRCVIATRDISAGELVLADFSVAAGPKEFGSPAGCCVICLTPGSSALSCGGCGLGLCEKRSCIRRHGDEEECASAFSKWIQHRQQGEDSKEDLRCLSIIEFKFVCLIHTPDIKYMYNFHRVPMLKLHWNRKLISVCVEKCKISCISG